MRFIPHLTAILCCIPSLLGAAPTTRAGDFTEALEQAKASGNDIVVLQRGSDWNRLGETLYQNVWSSPDFAKHLGEGFVLVTVDRPERPGAPPVGSGEDPSGLDRFLRATAAGAPLPADEITSIRAEGGAPFRKRADGTWLLDDPKGEHNPAHDTLTLNLRASRGGQLLRIDFLPDAALPNGCSGRAANGNFALSEIEVGSDGKPQPVAHIWADAAEADMPANQLIDGIKDKGGNGWNPGAHTRQPRSLILALATPVRAGADLKITLIGNTQWGQHIPACLRAAVFDDASFAKSLARVSEAQRLAANNASFTWWDGYHCPRVALVDSEGRAIASIDTPRSGLTPATLAEGVRKLRETRFARDELLARAQKSQGLEKAGLLRQSLDVLGFANWPGNGNCYLPIHDLIKQLDPQDQSGAVRWLGFSSDPKSGVPWAKPAWNEALDTQGGTRTPTDGDYQQAIARVDKELADPRNKILSHENIQRMMIAKFHIYRSWKGHEEERFRIQQEIADFDPDTFWGIGARGYLGMYGKSATPYLTYGWKPDQVKPGLNSWRMTDTGYFFDHPGSYKITLTHTGGAAAVKVKRLALMDGGTVVAEAKPDAGIGTGANASVSATLDCSAWKTGRSYALLAEIEAPAGQTDISGRFAVEPWLTEPAATSAKSDYFKARQDLRDKLAARFSSTPHDLAKAFTDESVRLDLARHELLRRCGTDAIDQLTTRPGGTAFLQTFTGDAAWMESFLANDDAKWPLAIENLRFLHHQSKGFDKPIYQRLATALALAAGEMNRYRMLNRYQDVVRTHKEGLLHASFDQLDVREMRWAIPLEGTAADYRFMVDVMQTRLADYIGACWAIPYIDPNVYGYSVQGWGYIDPWTHHYGTGTGDRPFPIHHVVGGVCGTLSGFGSAASKAHGVMATTVGQPAHCAYVVRVGNEWPTGNDVSGPETNAASVYEGTGFPTMGRLYEPIHADKAAFLKSSRLSWVAHLFLDRRATPATWIEAYQQAVAAQPIHYPLVLEFIKALETTSELPTTTWLKLTGEIATAYAPYHEAAWALANRCYAKAAPSMKPEERMALLLQCHQRIKQENAPRFFGYNLGAVLNAQADSLGDPVIAVTFMQKLLGIHFSKDPAKCRVFGDVLNWGRTRFAANSTTSAAYAKAIGTFFAAQGGAIGATQMQPQISAGIYESAKSGDANSWRLWTDMAARFLPPVQPGDVFLTPEQVKAFPKLPAVSGALLSKDGILQTSSAHGCDRPLSYRAILDGSAPGWFDTINEQKPWAQIALAGDAEVSSIVLVNRYEVAPDQDEFQWAVPLKVQLSTDGKTWTDAATVTKAEAVMRVDLAGKQRARYVRIERQAPADASKPPGRLHLRNFLVYGRKLY